MNYRLLIFCLTAGFYTLARLVNHVHMLQQNSYYPSRYCKWLKSEFPRGFAVSLILLACTSVLLAFKLYLWAAAFVLLLSAAKTRKNTKAQKSAVKPLVFTARVKRLFTAGGVFLLLIAAVGFVFDFMPAAFLCALLCSLPPVSLLLFYYLIFPAEKLISLHYISDAKRKLKNAKGLLTVGITGSFGKTGVKMMLKDLLFEKYNVVATPKSFNTPMGVVRTVRENLRRDTEVFLCEMGAKNKGDIKELCNIAKPSFGIITSVGEQHLETFKTLEAVASTKFELADACLLQNGGRVLVNFDSPAAREKAKGMQVISYGTTPDCDYYAKDVLCDRYGSTFTVVYGENELKLRCRLLGKHNVINLTGCVAAALILGVEPKDIAFATAGIKPAEHRLEPKNFIAGSVMIDDAYNANPQGCLEAVNVLDSFKGMQKVIITPGLVELGEKEKECNEALARAAAKVCDKIIFVGKKRAEMMLPAALETGFDKENIFTAESFADACTILSEFANENTAVLVENDLPDNYLK